MSYSDGGRRPPERRTALRVRAEYPARLQFITSISGGLGLTGAALWPSLVCRTRDVSEAGMGLEIPVLRESDAGFFGVHSPVHMMLGLPTGVIEARGITARYARGGCDEGGGFFVAVRITEMGRADADRFRTYLRDVSRGATL
jgi:hypothetical protein